jgi:hypothetical protein
MVLRLARLAPPDLINWRNVAPLHATETCHVGIGDSQTCRVSIGGTETCRVGIGGI